MAKSVALPLCIKLHARSSSLNERAFTPWNPQFRVAQRRLVNQSCNLIRTSTRKRSEYSRPHLVVKSSFMESVLNADGVVASDWIPIVDQVLLMASIFLTYTAGVVPVGKSYRPGKNISDNSAASERPTFSGSAAKNDEQHYSKYALDVVKQKLLDSLDAFQREGDLKSGVLEFKEHSAKQPLSLSAIAGGPRLRLLWASFQLIEEKVNNISDSKIIEEDGWLKVFSSSIRKSFQPLCIAWLKRELCLETTESDKALVSLISVKLKEDDNILQNIRMSGKEDLYADLMHFLSFGSVRKGCHYDHGLFIRHGTSILEDLVITLADGIANMYLELISVDGSFSNEINCRGFSICTLSTRALQKLRNEVVMNQWLYQNVEAIVSMYEDRFDLLTLERQLIEVQGNRQTEIDNWWARLAARKSKPVSSKLHGTVIHHFSMPVKRTKELRALTGWRYYFSLLIELSDITMPLIRAVIDKISSAMSFFLVCLIGRSLGLIYTGIRQSLKWK